MDDPELHGDERILLRTQGVHVKSISFEAILTSKRIILVDRVKNILPPKEIPLATIQSVETGENAIRDSTISLGVVTKSGGPRQMVLTFTREGGAGRAKERDEWALQIKAHLAPLFEQVIRKVMPEINSVPAVQRQLPAQESEPTYQPVPAKRVMEMPTDQVQAPPSPAPAPETILGTYCTKCGTKVPDGSAFCTKCGTRIVMPGEAAQAPAPFVQPPAAPRAPDIVQARPVATPPATPRPAQVPPESARPQYQPAPATAPARTAPKAAPQEKKRFMPRLFSPKALPPTPLAPPAARPRRQKNPAGQKKVLLALGIVVLLLIAVVGAFVVLPKFGILKGSSGSAAAATTTAVTAKTTSGSASGNTTVAYTQTPVSISGTGVVVKVDYLGGFSGTYTANGNTTKIKDSGTKVYQLDSVNGTVTATVQKTDNTATHALTLTIYKNGSPLSTKSTSVAYGNVTVSASV